jgi:hypothetical protein
VSATATTLIVAGEPAVQGMSAALATLYGALIAGVFTLLGITVGLVVEHWLRRRGELRIDTSPKWERILGGGWACSLSASSMTGT